MPDQRETPDSRRAARLMRDGAVRRAVDPNQAPTTRRAFREALPTVVAPTRTFAVTADSERLSAAMADALHASVAPSLRLRSRSSRAVTYAPMPAGEPESVAPVAAFPAPAVREPEAPETVIQAVAPEVTAPAQAATAPAQATPATVAQAHFSPEPVADATAPLPVTVAPAEPTRAILRPAAPPLATPVRPRAEPLLPTSPARHRAPVRHARAGRLVGLGASLSIAVAGLFVVGSAAALTATVAPEPVAVVAEAPEAVELPEVRVEIPQVVAAPTPLTAETVIPDVTSGASQFVVATCDQPAVTAALAAGDDAATIAAVGGAGAFRAAVAGGTAPCLSLSDPARAWVVVDKTLPLVPVDHSPATLVAPEGVRSLDGSVLRQDAAASMSAMVEAARAAGAGDVGVGSAFRSYETQVLTYDGHVARRGAEGADLVSARPGHSEHQTGLAADVVPCAEVCGTIDDLAATPQGAWIAEHAWEYGWIVRYEDGGTEVTGYLSEPWHLRYIGVDLAREYHDGGWHTLEEFFGLPAAPHYH
ncbi:D-alanyl-D-alanine carboxypeptidase family protein [Planococcus sp. APC 4015]|nr:D-alanyl-D-alanine carboxypeptidase family protein [Planococcus sp. APC 4015]